MIKGVTFPEDTLFFSMDDETLVSRLAEHTFKLEDQHWPSIEHYYQSKLFKNELFQAQIASCATATQARKMGKSWWRSRIDDWKNKRAVLMTRAVYTQVRTHERIREQLLATGDRNLIENSQYEHFWGIGRDQLGRNEYGQVLMNVRSKLLEELAE